MKNLVKWFGIIALIAVFGLSMAACNDDSGSGSGGGGGGSAGLVGTRWNYVITEGGITVTVYYTFTANRFSYGETFSYGGGAHSEGGTYSFNGKSGTLIFDDGDKVSFTVNGNKLTTYARKGKNEKDTVFTRQ